MKLSNGFDARRLRPREHKSWRGRLGALLGGLLAVSGLLLLLAGAASLIGSDSPALADLATERDTSAVFIVSGVLLLWAGVALWRRVRRRGRSTDSLSLSPRLLRKRN